MIDEKLEKGASVMYEISMKLACMVSWKLLISGLSINRRKQLLIKTFLNCVDLNSHNSRRQIAGLDAVEHFSMQRILIMGWVGLMGDYLRTR